MLHNVLREYLGKVAESIDNLDTIYIEKYEEEILTPDRCNLRIRIRFSDHHLLEINEALIVFEENLQHLNYRYHYQDATNTLIFRYDNSPHHPDISTFPDHKHVFDEVMKTDKPSIQEIIDEIQTMTG